MEGGGRNDGEPRRSNSRYLKWQCLALSAHSYKRLSLDSPGSNVSNLKLIGQGLGPSFQALQELVPGCIDIDTSCPEKYPSK